MRLPSFQQITEATLKALIRFPFTVLAALTAVGALIWLLEEGENPAARLWLTAQLGIPLLLACEIAYERPALRWGLPLVGLGLLGLCYATLHVDDSGFEYRGLPRFFAFLAAAHLLASVVPYLNKRPVSDFWTYNKELLTNWLIGATYAFVLFVTLSLAILAVDQLFDLNMNKKVYLHLFIVLTFLFITLYFLHHFPQTWSFEAEKPYSKGFSVLCKFILIPVMMLYAVIVLVYVLKIVSQWSLPQGYVSYLVLGFATVGILTYLLNYRLPETDDTVLPRWYKLGFWWALTPAVVLMLVSIGRRLSDYGITEPRYAVATAGVWLLAACLYFILSRRDNIKFIPISLVVVCLFVVLGPFNAFRVSERSQIRELRELLEANDRWESGKMKPSEALIPDSIARRISSVIQFFDQRNRLQVLEAYLPYPISALPKRPTDYSDRDRLESWLRTDRISGEKSTLLPRVSVQAYESEPLEVDVRNYETLYQVNLYRSSPEGDAVPRKEGTFFQISDNRKGVSLCASNKDKKGYTVLDTFDMSSHLKGWYERAAEGYVDLPEKPAVLHLKGRKMEMMLMMRSAEIEAESTDSLYLVSIDGWIFVRTKK